MSYTLNTFKFSKAIREKRIIELNIPLREASTKIGVGFSTLSRCENGGMPELIHYINICKWLKVPMETFISKSKRVTN